MASKALEDGLNNKTKGLTKMPTFVPSIPTSTTMGTETNNVLPSRIPNFGVFDQSLAFHFDDSNVLNRNSVFNQVKGGSQMAGDQEYNSFNKELISHPAFGNHCENWRDVALADASHRTDTSTDDTDERNPSFERGQFMTDMIESSDRSKLKPDQKNLRRLAQNREAARKSRLKKKAYVQQLESSKLKLTKLEQELQSNHQQGLLLSNPRDQSYSMNGNGSLAFDAEYVQWLEEHNRHMSELKSAVNSHAGDGELRGVVDAAIVQFNDVFRLKGSSAKADVFHILFGTWKSPAERCFMWMGGLKSSEVLKILSTKLEPLTEGQQLGIFNLQQSSQQTEDALTVGMESVQKKLAETLANSGSSDPSMAMAMALEKLEMLEGLLQQADNLRQQTLDRLHLILTTRQSARALLAINEYSSKLRALGSLRAAKPRD